MKLYHNPQSRAVTAHWMLEEVGADYELVHVEFGRNGERDPALLAVNPMGKVPTLVLTDGTVITEAPAICAYLADAYPAAGLAPEVGSPERGSYYRWLFFTGSAYEPALIDRMMRKGDPISKVSAGWGTYDDVVDTIEGRLAEHDYLVGDRFTAADLYLGAGLSFGGLFGAPRLKDSAVIQAYLGRLSERPAFGKVMGG